MTLRALSTSLAGEGATTTSHFMRDVYRWLALSTGLTAATAALLERRSYVLHAISSQPIAAVALLSAVLVVPVVFKRHLVDLPPAVVFVAHCAFAALLGTAMALVFGEYTRASAAPCFGAASLTYAALATFEPRRVIVRSRRVGALRFALMGVVLAAGLEWTRSQRLHRPWSEWALIGGAVLAYAALTAYEQDRIERARTAAAARGVASFPHSLQCATVVAMDFVELFVILPRWLRGR